MQPVIKWSGSKRHIAKHICSYVNFEYNNYYEPFIGGAAVLFSISPLQAVVNDVNEQLVNLYTQLKFSAHSVIDKVNEMDSTPCTKEYYYDIRKAYNEKIARRDFDPECTAFMIWINKHCFNGLYRVNNKGAFNVPYNNKVNGRSIDENNSRRSKGNSRFQICLDYRRWGLGER
mgnify:CR=1 FL=1